MSGAYRLAPKFFLLLFFGQCIFFAWTNGQTVDEPFYAANGYGLVRYQDARFLEEQPPLMAELGALPLLFLNPDFPYKDPVMIGSAVDMSKTGSKFLYQMGNNPEVLLFASRLAIIFLGFALGICLFRWAKELYGEEGALLSLCLFSFSPNLIAHSSLYTTDLGVAAFLFFAIYRLWKWFQKPDARNAVLTGVFCGLALLSKLSAILLLPMVFGLLFLAAFFKSKEQSLQGPNAFSVNLCVILALLVFSFSLSHRITLIALGPLCFVLLASAVPKRPVFLLCAVGWIVCFALAWTAKKLGIKFQVLSTVWIFSLLSAHFYTQKFRKDLTGFVSVFAFVWLIAALVVALGYADFYQTLFRGKVFHHFVRNFKAAFSHSMTHHMHCLAYSFVTCDWRYFLALIGAKTPVVTLALFWLGFVAWLGRKNSWLTKAVLFLPPLLFLLVASFINRTYIGLRHVLMIYPFMFLIAGAVMPAIAGIREEKFRKPLGYALRIGLVFLIIRNAMTLPYSLSYFNEFVGSAREGAYLTVDSNINWGQDNRRLAQFLKENKIKEAKLSIPPFNPLEFEYYKVNWSAISAEDYKSPSPGYYVLSSYAYWEQQQTIGSWFKGRRPDFLVGQTIYVFKAP